MLRITNIQRGSVYDGPGVRTTVFLKGCCMSCPWCCNPEAINYDENLWFVKNTSVCGTSIICNSCEIKCGNRPKTLCPFGVYKSTYKDISSDELYEQVDKDRKLFITSGGGITFSGGEPLMQAQGVLKFILKNDFSYNFWIESTLKIWNEESKELINYTDGIILDLKLQKENNPTVDYINNLKNHIEYIQKQKKKIIYRLVFVDSMVQTTKFVLSSLKMLNIQNIELIKCHNLAKTKYEQLGLKNSDFTPDEISYTKFIATLSSNHINVKELSL